MHWTVRHECPAGAIGPYGSVGLGGRTNRPGTNRL